MALPLFAAAMSGGGGGFMKILTNKWVIGGIVILAIILTIYFSGKSAGKNKGEKAAAELEKKYLDIKEGDEIPPGYDASVDVAALIKAGEYNWRTLNATDEETIFNILENRSPGQLKAINNFMVANKGQSLIEYLDSELDSDEMVRAMSSLRFIK